MLTVNSIKVERSHVDNAWTVKLGVRSEGAYSDTELTLPADASAKIVKSILSDASDALFLSLPAPVSEKAA